MKNSLLHFCLLILLQISFLYNSTAQPVVVTHPSDSAVCTGESAEFSIVAINTTIYQWQEHDGTAWYDISESITYASGEDTPNLLISDANLGLNNYQYRCYVKDEFSNSDTSQAATLFVNDIPVILSNPQNMTVCRNETATFEVESLNTTEYHWQENNGSGWQNLENNSFYQGVNSPVLSVYTVTGMNAYKYRCILYNNTCDIPSGEGILYVNPLPVGFNITGGGSYCEGEEGVEIGLSGSETNINYRLLKDNVYTGSVISGTGYSLSFGIFTEEGTYSINAINSSTSCTNTMNGTTDIVINQLPEIYNITGGGEYCEDGQGIELGLDNSEQDIKYELLLEDEPTGVIAYGTGNAISFDYLFAEGIYSVFASNTSTACSSEMEGYAEIIVNELPIANAGVDFSVSFGTSVDLTGGASGGSGNYNYFWSPAYKFENPNVQYPTTVNLTSTTIFTLNVIDETTSCISHQDTVLVTVTGGPLNLITTLSPQNICKGETSNLYALASGGTGSYQYEWTSEPQGFYSNNYNPEVSPEINTKYYVSVFDGMNSVSDSAFVFVKDPPEKYNVTGGGIFCNGGDGVEIGLDNSESNVYYEVILNEENTGWLKTGTGLPLSLGRFLQSGTYKVFAYNINYGCESIMNDSAIISNYSRPFAFAGEDQIIPVGTNANLSGTSGGGSGDYSYSWYPGYLLNNPYISNPSTINLYNSALISLTVTDEGTGCTSPVDSVIVFVSGGQLSIEILALSNFICDDDSMKILALPSGGSGNYTYSWTSNPEGFISEKNDPTISPDVTTKYYVSADDGIETILDSITIYVDIPPEKFNITGNGGYCHGSDGAEIGLDSSQHNVIYELFCNNYSTGIIVEGTGNAIQFQKQTTTGNYSVTGKFISSSCETPMNGVVSVYIQEQPMNFMLTGEEIYCEGSDGINLELSASQTGISYELFLDGSSTGVIREGTGLSLVFPNQTGVGIYSILATDQNSFCSKLMSGTVDVEDYPSPEITASNDTLICGGNIISLSAETDEDNYIWNTFPVSYSESILVSPFEDTIYSVFTYNSFGCFASADINVSVNESPQISAEHDLINNSIYVEPGGYSNYEFLLDNEIVQNSSSNEYIIPESIRKGDTIFVSVRNIFNCTSEAFVVIETVDNINAFSPNGDGINDVFMKGSEIIVFNRWGLKLFEGIDGWDGRYKGKTVAPGTYYFVQNLKDINGEIIRVIKGSVTVVSL